MVNKFAELLLHADWRGLYALAQKETPLLHMVACQTEEAPTLKRIILLVRVTRGRTSPRGTIQDWTRSLLCPLTRLTGIECTGSYYYDQLCAFAAQFIALDDERPFREGRWH